MRKYFFILVSLLILSSCEKETILTTAKIPTEITNYTNTHFPDYPIIQVKKEVDGSKLTYEVKLTGAYELEFNRKKEVVEIEGVMALPNSVIPFKLLQYVNSNYPDNFITEWDLEKRKQEITLDNDLQLEFDLDGNFIRIDD